MIIFRAFSFSISWPQATSYYLSKCKLTDRNSLTSEIMKKKSGKHVGTLTGEFNQRMSKGVRTRRILSCTLLF